MIYLKLFLSFFKVGMFSFGGGYASLPLIRNEVVDIHNWIGIGEFSDLITISQMTPGPIAVNAATFVGIKIAGITGAVFATLGCITPSCLLVAGISYVYIKYKNIDFLQKILKVMRPAIVSMIAASGLYILVNSVFEGDNVNFKAVILFLISAVLLIRYKRNLIGVMIFAGILNLIIHYISRLFV